VDEDDGRSWKAVAPQWRVYVDDALTATPHLGTGEHEGLQERRTGHIQIESDIRPAARRRASGAANPIANDYGDPQAGTGAQRVSSVIATRFLRRAMARRRF
jgi:hypothetical protein